VAGTVQALPVVASKGVKYGAKANHRKKLLFYPFQKQLAKVYLPLFLK
jgi:hypothetical protein